MLNDSFYVVILAGGKGSRLWPLSHLEKPKQFLPLLEGGSPIQIAWRRALKLVTADRVIVIGNVAYEGLYYEQLPDLPTENLVLEPVSCNTAAAIALGAIYCHRRCRKSVTIVLPSDCVILNEEEWCAAVRSAAQHARQSGRLVTVGVLAESIEPKFGYMVKGDCLEKLAGRDIFAVDKFIEKPDKATVENLLQETQCLQNMGTFAWCTETILSEIKSHLPTVSAKLGDFECTIGTDREADSLEEAYVSMPSISIDNGVLQHSQQLSVVPADICRVDIGDFSAFSLLWPRDSEGNAVTGHYTGLNSTRNIIYSPRQRIATVGIHDFVIVATDDTVLVCPKKHTQKIKDLLHLVEERKYGDHHS